MRWHRRMLSCQPNPDPVPAPGASSAAFLHRKRNGGESGLFLYFCFASLFPGFQDAGAAASSSQLPLLLMLLSLTHTCTHRRPHTYTHALGALSRKSKKFTVFVSFRPIFVRILDRIIPRMRDKLLMLPFRLTRESTEARKQARRSSHAGRRRGRRPTTR